MIKKAAKNYVTNRKSLIRKLIILLLICTISAIVYASGGTRTSLTHLMYIPIGIAAFYFDIRETMATALLSGLALGPLMSAFVSMDIMQFSLNWLFRIAMFMGIGLLLALLFRRVKNLKNAEIEKSFHHAITGLPNTYKLKLDLEKLIEQQTDFALVGFKIVNIGDINRYINYDIGVKSILKAIETLSDLVNRPIYSIFDDEFAVILPHTAPDQAYAIGLEFLNKLKDPFSISRCKIELIVNGGIVNFPNQAKTADDLIKKMDIALDEEKGQEKLVVYDNLVEQKNKEIYNLMVSLFDAIKNEEFYVVYQPQISVTDHAMTGVEALLRWNHQSKGLINPERFINLAEKMGIVSEITKLLIRKVLIQIKQWQQEGLSLKVALNISSQDLKDESFIDYLKKSLEENGLSPSMIELELTERSIVKNKTKALQLLNSLRDYGIKISLDDCGTGYNSLINFIALPIDNLKIDKTFIDDITVDHNKMLIIESIISFAQKTGKKVIAEGVETKQQCDLLATLGCDYIQGYYFSKPLPPEAIKAYSNPAIPCS